MAAGRTYARRRVSLHGAAATALRLAAAVVALASCAPPDDTSRVVPEAYPVAASRHALIGMDQTDIRMCAGFPTATADAGPKGTIWTYVKAARGGGVNFSLPAVGAGPLEGTAGSVSVTGTESCDMQIRFVKGRVVQVEFAGDSNSFTKLDLYCVPLVDSCVRYAQRGWSSGPLVVAP